MHSQSILPSARDFSYFCHEKNSSHGEFSNGFWFEFHVDFMEIFNWSQISRMARKEVARSGFGIRVMSINVLLKHFALVGSNGLPNTFVANLIYSDPLCVQVLCFFWGVGVCNMFYTRESRVGYLLLNFSPNFIRALQGWKISVSWSDVTFSGMIFRSL